MRMMPGKDYRPRSVTVTVTSEGGDLVGHKTHDLSATDYDYGTALVCEDVRKAVSSGHDVAVVHD